MLLPFVRRHRVLAVVLLTLAGLVTPLALRGAIADAATPPAPGAITLHVKSARTVAPAPAVQKGDAITKYHWLIAAEDAGNPHDAAANCLPARAGGSADFATKCQWPSVRETPGAVPVVAQGDETTLADGIPLADLPGGRYLISVTAGNYKIDGAHFSVDGGTQQVTVDMQPYPLPLGTIRIRAFQDSVPVDATYEVGAEKGIPGFTAHLSDVLGEVTTDYYGNPLCTTYEHASGTTGPIKFGTDGKPVVAADSTGKCVSDANGDITIPNMGPDRYAAQVVPNDPKWVQTTTLEGAHDHDIWVQEGDTGYDTEQTVGGERVPYVDFGYAPQTALTGTAAGAVKGVAVQINTYVGGAGGVNVPNAGVAGASVRGPVKAPWVALSALGNGDQAVYVGRGNADGSFDIRNVPNGDYQLTLWDNDQELILDSFNVTVNNGATVDVGQKGLVAWHARYEGTVFVDTNGNGAQDPGEQGIPRFAVALKERDNSIMDQGINTVTTDAGGHYVLPESYPLSRFLVMEAFNTRYKTTGITYQADNQPTPTTLKGAAVDVSVLPIIGLKGRVDWGVQPYRAPDNGGIVGTVTYDTTRNELDPADAVTESYQPGVPNVGVDLYDIARNPDGTPRTNPDGSTPLIDPATGAAVHGPKLAETYTSETWQRPVGCTPRQYDGSVLADQQAIAVPGDTPSCVEAPMQGIQVQPSDSTPGNFGQTVNGNYGFTTSTLNQFPPGDPSNPAPDHALPLYADLAAAGFPDQTLRPADYLVNVVIPDNPVGGGKMYQVTKEEDVNVFDGDGYLPQDNFPPSAAEAADPPGPPAAAPTPPDAPPSQAAGIVSACVGANHTVHVADQAFLDGGGSPFEGLARPLCDQKLVTVRAGQATAPNFNLFTPVPLPTHFWGLTINDLGLSNDKKSVEYGEAQGLAGVPMGVYDWAGKLVDTVDTDPNGFYEALEPSTSTYNCPLPAGPCPNMYRFVGNDPGQPGHLNQNYNRRYRTIATNFQAWPGLYTVTDTAPTQVAAVAIAPGSTQVNQVNCDPPATKPQLFAVDRPFIRSNDANRTITINGLGFGAARGTVQASLTGLPIPVNAQVATWSDTKITVTVPPTTPAGAYAVTVVKSDGQTSTNGITVHVLGTLYNPDLYQVNPPSAAPNSFTSVQAALTAANRPGGSAQKLVVVWPGAVAADNPAGAYFENPIMFTKVRLQGVGPGGFQSPTAYVRGSIIDGLGFNPDNDRGAAWFALLGGLTYAGPANVPDSAVVTVLAPPAGADQRPLIDGFTITGGAQADNATNLNVLYGNTKTPLGAPGAAITQGGGVYVHARVNNLSVSNNVIVGNSGSYGGAIRVGTPYVPTIHNANVAISHNQVRDNGGTNLAGGIGLFGGTDRYSVDHNDLCGNFSAEYGGGMTQYGLSTGGDIAANRLWLNESYDEGGGIMIAGELPSDPNRPSTGTGPVNLHENLVQDNVANDDGGGIRFLQAGNAPISVVNNMIDDNISTHEGGGLALDDATNVRVVDNTVMNNITTATAITSDGRPAPAGLSTALNSAPLQRTLPGGSPLWSNPVMFGNIFSGNLAGAWNGSYVTGIRSPQAPANDPVNDYELGSSDTLVKLAPTYSILTRYDPLVTPSPTNRINVDPLVKASYTVTADILTSRTFPSFKEAVIVAKSVDPALQGNYHLQAGSPAVNNGSGGQPNPNPPPSTVNGPLGDYDGQLRIRPDIGADEYYP
jgi:SdrD B-like domain/Polysaccharide lyase family 4, domain II/IPT/TIG domain